MADASRKNEPIDEKDNKKLGAEKGKSSKRKKDAKKKVVIVEKDGKVSGDPAAPTENLINIETKTSFPEHVEVVEGEPEKIDIANKANTKMSKPEKPLHKNEASPETTLVTENNHSEKKSSKNSKKQSPKHSSKTHGKKNAPDSFEKAYNQSSDHMKEVKLIKRTQGYSRRNSLTRQNFQVTVLDDKGGEENEKLLNEERVKRRDEAFKEREKSPLPGDISLLEIKTDKNGMFAGCVLNEEIMLAVFKYLFNFKIEDILEREKNLFQRQSRHENVIHGKIHKRKVKEEKQQERLLVLKRMETAANEMEAHTFGQRNLKSNEKFISKTNFLKFKEYSHSRTIIMEREIRNLREDFSKIREFSYFFLRLLM